MHDSALHLKIEGATEVSKVLALEYGTLASSEAASAEQPIAASVFLSNQFASAPILYISQIAFR